MSVYTGQEGMDGCKELAVGRADIGLMEHIEELDDTYEILPFEKKPLTLLVYKGHPLCGRKVVDVSELWEERFVSFVAIPGKGDPHLKIFQDTHVTPHVVMTATSEESIRRNVRDGFGVALVFENPLDSHEKGIEAIHVKTDISRNVYLCYPKKHDYPMAVEAFLEYAKKRKRWDGE